ncbi:cation transporter [Spirochaetia bacterium 38H-sp]|uniref:Cation transporter n=1 Tax=Rarispira pelagica TaxID=3141764 RepID=A0ABU9UBS2_9SPIR
MEKTITIDGMSCQHCVMHIKQALSSLGLEVVNVEIGKATVKASDTISDRDIKNAIEDAGYTVKSL